MIFNVYNSYLYYEENFGIVNDYYQMLVNLMQQILINNSQISINITLCNNNYNFNNNNRTIKINFNWEHTMVKEGGRDVPHGTHIGGIMYNNNYYFIRIERYDELNNSDIVIDYSIPNICNVKSCNLFNSFSNKHIYISSSIYESYFIKENRNITMLTTFINTGESRRAHLLRTIVENNIHHVNINNCFEKNSLQSLYKNTKILINIHQTDHHDTFEELRVLPALQCGVIVICEDSPLSELVPYNDYIIWTSYDKIVGKSMEVNNNYDYYYDLIFLKEKKIKLNDLNNINYNTLNDSIMNRL
jgi:hypothetical protein